MAEKFCLKWNDFHSNVSKSFGLFRNEDYLHDVTLVSDDHKQVSAHKLVLSACSEYFKDIFKINSKPNAHPLICLDGISSGDLKNIMDYIYNGEVQIFQEYLDRFLSIAQRLKLKGLIENEDSQDGRSQEDQHKQYVNNEFNANKEETLMEQVSYVQSNLPMKQEKRYTKEVAMIDKVMVPLTSEDVSEIENTVNQYIEKCDDGKHKCTLCGKVEKSGHLRHLKNHIETHLEGLSFPCQLCGKTFRSRNAYNAHKTRNHKFS